MIIIKTQILTLSLGAVFRTQSKVYGGAYLQKKKLTFFATKAPP